jgi:(p)ppGpp synthase/HD superfamily hydrolase
MKTINTIKKEHRELGKAIKFLVDKVLDKKGEQKSVVKTDKLLVIHSLETAFCLKNLGYDNKIVIAGLLHDLLEDTETTKAEIEKIFGQKIAEIVEALSFDFGTNKVGDYKKNFTKTANFKEALIVRAADIYENSKYFEFAPPKEYPKLMEKYNYFLKTATLISTEPIYRKLKRKVEVYHKNAESNLD